MRLTLTRRFTDARGQSVFGELAHADGQVVGMTCEREWNDNRPGESCVPTGFYVL